MGNTDLLRAPPRRLGRHQHQRRASGRVAQSRVTGPILDPNRTFHLNWSQVLTQGI